MPRYKKAIKKYDEDGSPLAITPMSLKDTIELKKLIDFNNLSDLSNEVISSFNPDGSRKWVKAPDEVIARRISVVCRNILSGRPRRDILADMQQYFGMAKSTSEMFY
jgi:hypothetical protein